MRIVASRWFATTVLVMLVVFGAVGCGRAATQPSGSNTQHLQATAQDATSYAVSDSKMPSRCARREPRSIASTGWAPMRRRLAPLGAGAVRLCRYGTLPELGLRRSTLLTASSVTKRLLADFDRLPPPPLHVRCPEDLGSEIVAYLAYPAGHRVAIAVSLTGCQLATNGELVRSASGFATSNRSGPALLAELRRLV